MTEPDEVPRPAIAATQRPEVAVLAGGCFWGVEEILRSVPGVIETVVGYTGGWLENPTAERVRARVEASGRWKRPITTTIEPASTWYSAEGYHQDYLGKNPGGYTCHFMRE